MYLLARIALIAGIGLSIMGGFDLYLMSRGTATPAEITLTDLGKLGPIENTHVTVSEFKPASGMVIERRNERLSMVWVPLLKPDGTWPERPVMAYFTGVKDEAELKATLNQPELTGVITNGQQGFGRTYQEQLAPHHPGVDLSDAIAFHVGKAFPSALRAVGLTVAGVVLLIFGGGYVFGLFPRKS